MLTHMPSSMFLQLGQKSQESQQWEVCRSTPGTSPLPGNLAQITTAQWETSPFNTKWGTEHGWGFLRLFPPLSLLILSLGESTCPLCVHGLCLSVLLTFFGLHAVTNSNSKSVSESEVHLKSSDVHLKKKKEGFRLRLVLLLVFSCSGWCVQVAAEGVWLERRNGLC